MGNLLDYGDGSQSVLSARPFVPGTATTHRSAVAAADVLAAPGTVTTSLLTGVGSAANGAYDLFVVAGNTYGRTTATQGTQRTTSSPNSGVRAAFAAVTGATFYDLFMSTDGAAAKFVGRVTEAQRASGIILTAVNTTGAGGTAGAVDVYVAGTGLAVNGGQLATNTAWTPESITGIAPGKTGEYIDFGITASRTGDIAAQTLVVIPFYLGSGGHYWAEPTPTTFTFGGAATTYQPLRQSLRVNCRGRTTVLVVASIAGTGASVDVEYVVT